jgi:hypothetical protein
MPVRKPPKNFRSLTGAFYSLKNEKTIYFESKLERDLFLTLEFDKTVSSYEEQPVKLFYERNNRTYPYTPDCLVHYNNDQLPCIIEAKYSDEIKEKKVFLKQKFDQIERYLYENDFTFKLFSELDIDPIALENMNFIYNYVTVRNQNKAKDVFEKLSNIKSSSYTEVLEVFSHNKYEQAEYIPYIWYLVLIKKLEIDISKKITKDTMIKVVA